jgi:short-subunit dehydrogenase
MTSSAQLDAPTIDPHHLLVIGAGPGLGAAIARRFARGGYHVTLLARSKEKLESLASEAGGADGVVDTVTADISDLGDLRATLDAVYSAADAPGLMVYNAVLSAPDTLLESDPAHLHAAYDVDVVGAIVATQVAAAAMRKAGGGTILFTGGGFAYHPVPAMATISLGKAALRSAAIMLSSDLAQDGVRVATITIEGIIADDTPFSPDKIADAYWKIVRTEDNWQGEFQFQGT